MLGKRNGAQGRLLFKSLFVGLKKMSLPVTTKHSAHCNIHRLYLKVSIMWSARIIFQSGNLIMLRVFASLERDIYIFFKPISDRLTWKSIHELGMQSVRKNVIGISLAGNEERVEWDCLDPTFRRNEFRRHPDRGRTISSILWLRVRSHWVLAMLKNNGNWFLANFYHWNLSTTWISVYTGLSEVLSDSDAEKYRSHCLSNSDAVS